MDLGGQPRTGYVGNVSITLTEFYQQISRRLRHQFGRGVRNVECIAKGKFRP